MCLTPQANDCWHTNICPEQPVAQRSDVGKCERFQLIDLTCARCMTPENCHPPLSFVTNFAYSCKQALAAAGLDL